MTQNEYLKRLKRELHPLKREDRDSILEYYKEMIEDRMENGDSEELAVSKLESPEAAARRALEEYGKDNCSVKNRRLSGGAIACLIIGSPLWLALAVAALSLIIAFVAVVFSIIVAIVAVTLALIIGGAAGAVIGIVALFSSFWSGLITFGFGLVAAVLGCFLAIAIFKFAPVVFSKARILILNVNNKIKEIL